MNYKYDIFISYKRYDEWTFWVRDKLLKLLQNHLAMELGYVPKIFIDSKLEAGVDWQKDLARKLATSRILVPLFSKMYFSSNWCIRELYAAKFKETQLGLRTINHPTGLIVAGRIHDGKKKDLPVHLHDCCRIEAKDLSAFAITSIQKTSPRYELFEIEVKQWVEMSIAPAIRRTLDTQPDESWIDAIANLQFDCPPPAVFDRTTFTGLG